MNNITLSQFVNDTIENLNFNKEEILNAVQNSDQRDDFDGLSILIKYYEDYLYIFTIIPNEHNILVLSLYKIKNTFLTDFVNPLVMRSIIDRITNDIRELRPYELMRLFMEIFAKPIMISEVGLKTFYIDQNKKIIAEGILDIQKYRDWITN